MANQQIKRDVLRIEGMTCAQCERLVREALQSAPGVVSATADALAQTATIAYDPAVVSRAEIERLIGAAGYRAMPDSEKGGAGRKALAAAGLAALVALLVAANLLGARLMPRVQSGMGFALLLLTGLLSSLHCAAMCGGIAISQGAGGKGLRRGLAYNAGRILSYALIGGLVGALGSVIPMPASVRGAVTVAAGAFMVVAGLNMMGALPILRRLTPRLPRGFAHLRDRFAGAGPFAVGLLNGLMPCGPLQSMQLYALGTGSFQAGALSMLAYGLGTAPLMLGLGAAGGLLRGKDAGRLVLRASAALVVALGVMTLLRGANLTAPVAATVADPAPPRAESVQRLTSELAPGAYPDITVRRGVPVEWTLHAAPRTVNGCNDVLVVPAYGLEIGLGEGDNLIKFTPTEAGEVPYSCWMGMIRGRITVVDDAEDVPS